MVDRIELKSEVAGKVWQIETKIGDMVAVDDAVIVLESMKMEIPVEAVVAGKLVEILVTEGDPIAEGQAVAIIEV